MAYLGNDLQVAFPTYRNIDDISGSFNSSATSFPLLVNGVAPVPQPLNSQQCLISVGGVVQRPDDSGTEGFRLSGGNIIFAVAPTTGADFFGVILAGADYVNAGRNFPIGSAAVPSITFDDDLDTGIYSSGANQLSVSTSGVERLRVDSAGQIESASLGSAASPAFSFINDPNTGIYSPGADQLALTTNGTGRLFVDSSGRVGIGTTSPGQTLSINAGANQALGIWNRASDNVYGGIHFKTSDGATGQSEILNERAGTNGAGLLFYTKADGGSASERARIDSSGRLLVGTSSAQGTSIFQAVGNSSASTDPGDIRVIRGLSISSIGTNVGAELGIIRFGALENSVCAQISAVCDANWSATDTPGRLVFSTTADGASSPTERMRIDSAGRVGIGTTNPGAQASFANQLVIGNASTDNGLTILSGTNKDGALNFNDGDNANTRGYLIYRHTTDSLDIGTNGSLRATVDSSGRFLVGTSSVSGSATSSFSKFQIQGNTFSSSGPGILAIRNGTAGSSIVNGTEVGQIVFSGSDNTDFARIDCIADGATGVNDYPSRLVFYTTADGASSPTERMRISRDGLISSLLAGTTNEPNLTLSVGGIGDPGNSSWITPRIDFVGSSLASPGTTFIGATGGFGNRSLVFATGADGAGTERMRITAAGELLVGGTNDNGNYNIQCNGTGVWGFGAYVNGSDERLKENINPISSSLNVVKSLNPVTFQYKKEFTKDHSVQPGFIAQELQQALADQTYLEGVVQTGPQYLNVAYQSLIPVLTKALQEAIAKIETLEAKVAALESA